MRELGIGLIGTGFMGRAVVTDAELTLLPAQR